MPTPPQRQTAPMAIVRKLGLLLAALTVVSLGLVAVTADAAACKYNNGNACPQTSPCCSLVRNSSLPHLPPSFAVDFIPPIYHSWKQRTGGMTTKMQNARRLHNHDIRGGCMILCSDDTCKQLLTIRWRTVFFQTLFRLFIYTRNTQSLK